MVVARQKGRRKLSKALIHSHYELADHLPSFSSCLLLLNFIVKALSLITLPLYTCTIDEVC